MADFYKYASVMAQVRRINRELESVVDACQGPVGDTLFTQASLVASEIRSVAPVSHDSEPGQLRDSVRVERGNPTAKRAIVVKVKAGGTKTQKTSKSGVTYDYARAIEFGSRDNPAHPFFFPIWRARRKDVHAAVKASVRKAVRGVFK